jgi:hypothetical protein
MRLSASTFDGFSTFNVAAPAYQQPGDDRSGNGLEDGKHLLDQYGRGVRDKDDVLISDRKLVR